MKNKLFKISLSVFCWALVLNTAAQTPAAKTLKVELHASAVHSTESSSMPAAESATPTLVEPEKTIWVNTVEKVKRVSRSYEVNTQDKLDISNQFGTITVHTWDKNEIKVEVEIKGYGKDEADAQKFIDRVSIIQRKTPNLIGFQTQLDNNKINNSNFNQTMRNGGGRRGVEINYTITMPSKNPLEISNKYGSTVLSDFDGPLTIDNSYGSFSAQKINHRDNKVNVRYGSATITSLEWGDVAVSYGSLKIAQAKNIQIKNNYGSIKIETLSGSGSISVGYGNLKVDSFNRIDGNWTIGASYSGVSLGIGDQANFNFEVTTSYGGFNYLSDRVEITSKSADDDRGWNPTKTYKGRFGKGSNSLVSIKAGYGNVKFN